MQDETSIGESQEKIRISVSEISPVPVHKIDVQFLGSKRYFSAFVEDLDDRTDREYQRLITHNHKYQWPKLRDQDLEAGAVYLMDKKLRGTNIDWNIYKPKQEASTNGNGSKGHTEAGFTDPEDAPDMTDEIVGNLLKEWGYADDRDFLLRDKEHGGRRYLMSINAGYWRVVRPDVETAKS